MALSPYGRSKGGIVTEMSLWNDGAAAGWEPYWTTGDAWYLPADDGVKVRSAQFRDLRRRIARRSTTRSPSTRTVRCARRRQPGSGGLGRCGDGQVPRQRQPGQAGRGDDPHHDQGGSHGQDHALGRQATGKLLSRAPSAATWPRAYKIVVKAKDLAGNPQSKIGTNTLTVGE